MRKQKKGQFDLQALPNTIIILVLAMIILGAGLLAIGGFSEAVCEADGGTVADGGYCMNSTGGTVGAVQSYAFNATLSGSEGVFNVSDQLPVIGTIVGVAVLITVVVGAFFAMRNRI